MVWLIRNDEAAMRKNSAILLLAAGAPVLASIVKTLTAYLKHLIIGSLYPTFRRFTPTGTKVYYPSCNLRLSIADSVP